MCFFVKSPKKPLLYDGESQCTRKKESIPICPPPLIAVIKSNFSICSASIIGPRTYHCCIIYQASSNRAINCLPLLALSVMAEIAEQILATANSWSTLWSFLLIAIVYDQCMCFMISVVWLEIKKDSQTDIFPKRGQLRDRDSRFPS